MRAARCCTARPARGRSQRRAGWRGGWLWRWWRRRRSSSDVRAVDTSTRGVVKTEGRRLGLSLSVSALLTWHLAGCLCWECATAERSSDDELRSTRTLSTRRHGTRRVSDAMMSNAPPESALRGRDLHVSFDDVQRSDEAFQRPPPLELPDSTPRLKSVRKTPSGSAKHREIRSAYGPNLRFPNSTSKDEFPPHSPGSTVSPEPTPRRPDAPPMLPPRAPSFQIWHFPRGIAFVVTFLFDRPESLTEAPHLSSRAVRRARGRRTSPRPSSSTPCPSLRDKYHRAHDVQPLPNIPVKPYRNTGAKFDDTTTNKAMYTVEPSAYQRLAARRRRTCPHR